MEELAQVVERARAGESRAFEALVRRFQDMAVGYAYSLLGDWHEAEDAAQDAFVSAYCSIVQLRDAAAFPGWFRRIVYTQAQRRLRVKTPVWVSLEQVSQLPVAGPARSIEAGDDGELWALVDSLPEAQRSVLLLFYIRDFSQKEIAAFLEIPLGTVKTRLHHARKRIQKGMTPLNEISAQRPSRGTLFTEKIMRLFEAAKSGDLEQARALLAADGRLANASGYIRTSLWGSDALALHVAVMHGRKDIVDLLLAHGADINARDDKYGFNALIHAIDLADFMPEYAALGMVDFLLERGAEKDVWACAWLGDGAGVDAWLRRDPALVNAVGPGPSTLLSFCSDVKAIQYYLDRGADPLIAYERSGKYGSTTPLRDIAYRRNYDCVRLLLTHLGWEVDIFWAGIMGDGARAGDLLAADAALAMARTAADHVLGGGLSALHLAAQGGHIALMTALLAAGAEIDARDDRGYTPLHFAICFGPRELLDPLPDLAAAAADVGVYRLLTDVPRYLLEQGADLSARDDKDSYTPLELARAAFEDETDRGDVIALLEAAEAQGRNLTPPPGPLPGKPGRGS